MGLKQLSAKIYRGNLPVELPAGLTKINIDSYSGCEINIHSLKKLKYIHIEMN